MSAPTVNVVLAYKLPWDVPGTEMKAGDVVFADPKPGWSGGKGMYVARVTWKKGETSTVGVGFCDPFTKRGKLRKRLVVGNFRFSPGDNAQVHRVTTWQRSI